MVCDGPRAAGPRGREGVDVASGGARAIPTEAQQTDACGSRFGPTSAPARARTGGPTSQGRDRQPVTASLRDTVRPGDQKDRLSPR